MKLFLSYASENYGIAEEVYFALVGDGHEIFFDRPSLKPGDNYVRRLREAIGTADGVIFLISPESVQGGGYALTELKYTRQRWASPEKRVLPVMVKPTRFEVIPAYLRAVTILQPEGNIAAEVVEAVNGWGKPKPDPAGRKDLFQEVGELFRLVVSSLFVTVGLGTLFSLFYPRVEINLGLTSLFVLAGLVSVLATRGAWKAMRRLRTLWNLQ